MQRSLPTDIALTIASSLQVLDLCALGSCSRFWREICGFDCLWESLVRDRWPSSVVDCASSGKIKGWREVYIRMHKVMASRAAHVIEVLGQYSSSKSLEVVDYYKAIDDLRTMQLGFGDIRMFFFTTRLSVLLNLVGLHYCIFSLKVPGKHIEEALLNSNILERQVFVRWWKLGRWFYGFRMRDESHSRRVSLADLVTGKGVEVLGVLQRGAIHEVLQVEISSSDFTSTPWSCQSSQA